MKKCILCSKKITGRRKKYCSEICKNRMRWRRRDKAKRLRAIKLREEIKKKQKCNICGWKKHPEILEFHHKNRKDKGKSFAHLLTKPAFKKELAKCNILCPNCHTYIHYLERKNNPKYNIKII